MKSITPRIIKFRAFADLGELKLMLDDVTVHAASGMVGLHAETLEEILESTDWKIDDDYFQNKVTGERIEMPTVGVYEGDEYYFFEGAEVMQFTNLHDKDGKEIYGDDIIYIPAGNPYDVVEGNHKVVWGLSGWYIEPLEGFRYADVDDSDLALYNFAQSAKVNGNIHQPELIEGDSTTLK